MLSISCALAQHLHCLNAAEYFLTVDDARDCINTDGNCSASLLISLVIGLDLLVGLLVSDRITQSDA